MRLFNLSIFFLLLIPFVYSCSSSDRDEDTTLIASAENSTAENLMNDTWKQIHSIILADTILNPQDSTPPGDVCIDSLQYLSKTYPLNFKVFFGGNGKTCTDGRKRKGIVNVSLSAKYMDSASVANITFQNYAVDDLFLSGTLTITNLGNVKGLTNFAKVVKNGRVKKDGAGVSAIDIMYDASQRIVWQTGITTDTVPSDDAFTLSGTTSGRNSRGKYFTTFITSDLQIGMDCKWEKTGKYVLKLSSLADRHVDLGAGACDNEAQIKVNGALHTTNF